MSKRSDQMIDGNNPWVDDPVPTYLIKLSSTTTYIIETV